MKRIFIITSIVFLYGCSETSKENRRNGTGDSIDSGVLQIDPDSENALSNNKPQIVEKGKQLPEGVSVVLGDVNEEHKEAQLSLVQVQPALRFLDSKGLEHVFRPIFGDSPRGNADFFTKEEKRSLGTISLHNDTKNLQNLQEVRVASIDYIRSVRSFLADACNRLINREISDISEDNILVKSSSPSKEHVSAFLGKLLGYNSESLIDGTEEIYAVMNAATQGADIETVEGLDKVKKSYLLMCVSLGSDIRVVSR